jgi:RNA polymerase sigma factor (TIGR02999 family)
MGSPHDITQMLGDWSRGDDAAGERMAPIVFDELRAISRRLLQGERSSHTLQPTALVNEAFERLVKVDVDWQDRAHFYAFSARLMRRILINHAERRSADKRGGDRIVLSLTHGEAAAEPETDAALIELHDAIEALAVYDDRKARLIELQYFGGLTVEEMACVEDISQSTVARELRFARAWLKNRLQAAG